MSQKTTVSGWEVLYLNISLVLYFQFSLRMSVVLPRPTIFLSDSEKSGFSSYKYYGSTTELCLNSVFYFVLC